MTPRGANNAVIVSSVVTLGSTTGASLTKGNGIHGKTVVGGFLAMAGCAVLAELNPDLGGYLAILIATGAFIYYGLPLIDERLGFNKQKAGEEGVEKDIREHGGFPTEKENREVYRHAARGEKEVRPGVYVKPKA